VRRLPAPPRCRAAQDLAAAAPVGAALGGTISYNGTGGALVGTGILTSTFLGLGTAANAGVALSCDTPGTGATERCSIDFTTGANTGEGPMFWSWAGGGSISVTGSLYDGATLVASGTLMTGSFVGQMVFGFGNTAAAVGVGPDSKNEDLLAFYGIPADQAMQFTLSVHANGTTTFGANGSINGTINQTDLTNINVPEPMTLGILGAGLAGLGLLGRRRCFLGPPAACPLCR
jgi:hypothetical protein